MLIIISAIYLFIYFVLTLNGTRCAACFVERYSQYAVCVGSGHRFLIVREMKIVVRTRSFFFFLILKMNICNHCSTEKHHIPADSAENKHKNFHP